MLSLVSGLFHGVPPPEQIYTCKPSHRPQVSDGVAMEVTQLG